jgi:hypothetical protein
MRNRNCPTVQIVETKQVRGINSVLNVVLTYRSHKSVLRARALTEKIGDQEKARVSGLQDPVEAYGERYRELSF